MQWTDAQRAAISLRGCNLLVSAAAGSGKTAVLAERIVSVVREEERVGVDDLLVVTFTRAAAAEMRGRILKALQREAKAAAEAGAVEKAARFAEQAMRVERADISTLHGFCGKVCREHFQAVGIDPMCRVMDDAERGMLRAQAVQEALLGCFEAPTPAFAHASLCFSQKVLEEAVLSLHTFLMARPDPFQWMDEKLAMYDLAPEEIPQSAWADVLVGAICIDAEAALQGYEALCAFAEREGLYVDFARAEREACRALAEAAGEGFDALMHAPRKAPGRKPTRRKDTDEEAEAAFVALRDAAKVLHKGALDGIAELSDILSMAEALNDSGVAIAGIYEAMRQFDAAYSRLKMERNVMDYGDLEHFALKALSDPAVAWAYQRKYAHIFIDEYQDASLLQEAILGKIVRGNNLFMVGDVKQSIYRFRLAEPTLFLEKLKRFSAAEGAMDRKVFLSANFRSTPRLLRFINQVFARVFTGGPMEITYDEAVRLIPGKEAEREDAQAPAELHLIMGDAEEEDERKAIAYEAEIIAQRIDELRKETPLRLRDMAILMRAVSGRASTVVEALRAHGIAAWTDMEEDALERVELQVIVSLLMVIDNLRQDVPLIAALRGPALGISDEALTAIRVAHPSSSFSEAFFAYAEKDDDLGHALKRFIKRARDWALEAAVLPLDVFVRKLYQDTGYYAEVGASPDGGVRQAALRMLAEHAGAFQRTMGGGSLAAFLRYIARVKSREGIAAMELGAQEDIVRVLSIHKSKGLQFPAVFIAGLGTQFRRRDGLNELRLHGELGAGLIAVNPMLRTRQRTMAQKAIAEKKRQEDLAEEARILYVAMTRAEQRLFLIASAKDDALEAAGKPPLAAKCMLDWIVPSARDADARVICHQRAKIQGSSERQESLGALWDALQDAPPGADDRIWQGLAFSAPVLHEIPLKQSVSQRIRVEAKQGEMEGMPLALESLPKRPFFMEKLGLTAAERGDAVHAFLRCVALDALDAAAAAAALVARGILTAEQAGALPLSLLQRLLESELWQRMRGSQEVHREWAFNLRVDQAGEAALLQGVIDCCFRQGDGWVLVDYKTDRIQDETAILARYRPQIALYRDALEKLSGRKVLEMGLYLVAAAKWVPVG